MPVSQHAQNQALRWEAAIFYELQLCLTCFKKWKGLFSQCEGQTLPVGLCRTLYYCSHFRFLQVGKPEVTGPFFINWLQFVCTPFWHVLHPQSCKYWMRFMSAESATRCLYSLLTACVSRSRNSAIDFYHLWCSSALPAVNVWVALQKIDLKPQGLCLHS